MRRRTFIAGLCSAAARPLAVQAQQSAMPVIGYLGLSTSEQAVSTSAAFRRGLRETGFIDGQNVTIEYRHADNKPGRLAALAADLVRKRPAVIAAGSRTADAAKAATQEIPIVFFNGGDPVAAGLVTSINRPGGNMTGVSLLGPDLAGKRVGLLHDALPKASTIGILNDSDTRSFQEDAFQAAARGIGLATITAKTTSEADWNSVFATLLRAGIDALLVASSTPLYSDRNRLVPFINHHRIPTMFPAREFAEIGGLMAYGPGVPDLYREMGVYAGRILKGDRPADLPVLLPTKFEFALNLKTANALGLTIPPNLLAIADEVIEWYAASSLRGLVARWHGR
jgi:putative ABC transport system substrate-binding protein